MADAINGNKKLWNLASRCVVKNYNDVKRIADLNGDFGNHVVDTSNPHNVNKSQVGLGNVQNIDTTNPANITQSSSYRFVTDTEKNTWNSKQSPATTLAGYGITDATPSSHIGSTGTSHGVVTTSINGFMSSTDKTKLDGVETGANNYTHPSSHPPSIITQDASNRFVTDTEKSTWNSKSDFSGSYNDLTDIPSGYTGSITVVTDVTPSVLTKTITITNGIITDIS